MAENNFVRQFFRVRNRLQICVTGNRDEGRALDMIRQRNEAGEMPGNCLPRVSQPAFDSRQRSSGRRTVKRERDSLCGK